MIELHEKRKVLRAAADTFSYSGCPSVKAVLSLTVVKGMIREPAKSRTQGDLFDHDPPARAAALEPLTFLAIWFGLYTDGSDTVRGFRLSGRKRLFGMPLRAVQSAFLIPSPVRQLRCLRRRAWASKAMGLRRTPSSTELRAQNWLGAVTRKNIGRLLATTTPLFFADSKPRRLSRSYSCLLHCSDFTETRSVAPSV